ncbi:MAG: PDGLE domain-containing protein [Chloroflexota bacterium]|nr:PDGLE domain-containing protein [Chloroflexota bacterium]
MKLKWWHIGLLIALGLAIVSPLASSWPDGLEKVAEDKGFIEEAQDPTFEIISDYVFPGVGSEALATILAGIVGTLILFALTYGLGTLLKRREAE